MRGTLALVIMLGARLAHGEPDEDSLGKANHYPLAPSPRQWTQAQYRVGSWSAVDKVPGTLIDPVARGEQVRPLPPSASSSAIRYRHGFFEYSLDDYLERQRVTGLLILKDGEIVAERYRYGRNESDRFLSFSMAKSITSLLVGIAQSRGHIHSLDDKAGQYVKALADTPYGDTSLRHLLRMSSGLTFTERYDGRDDVARLSRAVSTGQPSVISVLGAVQDRHSPPGVKFVYASAETEVLGRVLTAATGKTLGELTSEWLWKPMGAEHDAFWCTAQDGQASAYFCFNASLRDWGRLGLLLARDGQWGEQQIIPRDYLLDATDATRQPGAFAPGRATPYFGYGYQFWLHPLRSRTFAMQGVHGQSVFVQPESGIVMVQTAVYAGASGLQDPSAYMERTSMWMGVLQSLGGKTTRY
jgi:CubicO group peptidase (beta-lactamase class C family)